MRLAVLSDIHGNIHALDAVLQRLNSLDPDLMICLGDLVGYGAFPNEVIETIRQHHFLTVRGNYDDGVGFQKTECGCSYNSADAQERGQCSFDWTLTQITKRNQSFLASLPDNITLQYLDKSVLFVHGSPHRLNEYLYEDSPESSLSRALEGKTADILFCGHTHLPYHRIFQQTHIINAGSVGKPKDGDPRACFILVEIGDQVHTSIYRVTYDIKAAASAIRKTGLPDYFAEALEQARG